MHHAFIQPSPALLALPLWISATSDRFVERSCGPNCWKHLAPPQASLSHCATSRGTTTATILFQLEVHARSRRLACGEITKGIDDDAQSTRVCSIGRGDGSLAGVGWIGSSVNHRLA